MTPNRTDPPERPIRHGLIVAGVLVAISIALKLLSPARISSELSLRLLGVAMGCVVVLYANAVPKALTPLVQMRCDPAAEQALRRLTGWSLVAGGAAFAAAWAIAPMEYAAVLSMSLLGAALLLVIIRFIGG